MTTDRLGAVKMKTSTMLTEALAAAVLLTCAAATPAQAEASQASASHSAGLTDYELKNLFVVIRPNVAVASPTVLARALKMAPVEKPIDQCITSPTATRVVKLRINNNFHVKNTGHDAVSKKPTGGGVKSVKEPAPLNAESTTYDMKFDKFVWDAHNQIIAVKVILKDRDLVFLSDEESITTVKTTTPSMFICLDKIKSAEDKNDNDPDDDSNTGQDKWDQATFYVDETKIQTQKFNIRVIVRHQDRMHVLPIIIDPVVENNGFN